MNLSSTKTTKQAFYDKNKSILSLIESLSDELIIKFDSNKIRIDDHID